MPDNTHPVVGERVRVKVGLTTIEGTVTDIYQASNGLRVVVETIDDDPELGRQVHTIAVPVEQIIIDGQRKDAPPSVPATPGQRRRGGAGKFVLKKGRTGKFH